MHDSQRREEQERADTGPEELRRLAAALRARLCFHRQCGIASYPFIAAPQFLSQSAQPQNASAASHATGRNVEATQPQGQTQAADSLAQVNLALQTCNRCPLGRHASARLSGIGPAQADFMVVGDYALQGGPQLAEALVAAQTALCFGADEDVLLWKMMQAIQLGPQEVYVTNALKCQPTPGEEPDMAWLRQCGLYLVDEIQSVRPRLICAMGEVAATVLLGGSEPVARLRGRIHNLQAGGEGMAHYPVMVTYHPRFLLRVADMKRAAWEDLQHMQKLLRQRGKSRLK